MLLHMCVPFLFSKTTTILSWSLDIRTLEVEGTRLLELRMQELIGC